MVPKQQMSHVMRKQCDFRTGLTQPELAVQAQKMAQRREVLDLDSRGLILRVAISKALISFAVTAKLICAFGFAYAKCWYSHDAVQINR